MVPTIIYLSLAISAASVTVSRLVISDTRFYCFYVQIILALLVVAIPNYILALCLSVNTSLIHSDADAETVPQKKAPRNTWRRDEHPDLTEIRRKPTVGSRGKYGPFIV